MRTINKKINVNIDFDEVFQTAAHSQIPSPPCAAEDTLKQCDDAGFHHCFPGWRSCTNHDVLECC